MASTYKGYHEHRLILDYGTLYPGLVQLQRLGVSGIIGRLSTPQMIDGNDAKNSLEL